MADNAAKLTDTLLYHSRLIRRASSATNDETSAENLDVTQTQSETSTPSSVSSSLTESASISSSSNFSTSSQITSSTTSPPVNTSPTPRQPSSPTSVQQAANTSNPPPITDPPAQSESGSVPRPPDTTEATTTLASVTDTSSKLAVNASPSVSSPSLTHGTSPLTGMISVPSDSTNSGDSGTSGKITASTGGSPSKTLPIIIGSVVGGVALILLLLLILFFLRQRKRRKQQIETLKWETVHEPADEPMSPLSSDSGHGLIERRIIHNSLDGHVRMHWVNPASDHLESTQTRGNSPGGASTVSTMSSVTFARPAFGTSPVTPTGHYTPSGSESGHTFGPYLDEGWSPQSRKTRPSMMTLVNNS